VRIGAERDALPRLLAFVYAPLAMAGWWAIEHGWLRSTGSRSCSLLDRTGIACPTCGGTRSLQALGHFDLVESLSQNPLVAIGAVVLVIWTLTSIIATMVPHWRVRLILEPRERKAVRMMVGGIVLATWVYEIIRHFGPECP